MSNELRIPLADISHQNRLRSKNSDKVEDLISSIQEIGLLYPIIVRPAREVDPKDHTKWAAEKLDGYMVVCGMHRLSAAWILQWDDIPAIVVEPETPLDARMIEIDENLRRHELNAFDEAKFLAEKQEIYWEKYPETKPGGDRKSEDAKNQNGNIPFCSEAANLMRCSESKIQKQLKIAKGLSPESHERIDGSWISNKHGELLNLARCDPETQAKYLDLMLREENPLLSVAKCKAHLAGKVDKPETPEERRLNKLKNAWKQALQPEQGEFLQWLADQGITLPEASKEVA
ncbi:ParB N-terminal domain-containing protein [Terasakiella sp. A23]|uniref:ParB/RepB/Spo0J family partition protein n=1 Tax=Terasakiella sp. FCG-A23 TaxID=3080561 RepID=UPI00295541CE|nr:ParB N-terminal domain-containing protein [Terasakiella sp. A23]MDV7341008.1 ParB N-terminal domain-containing protein [Terasakiella sp. A23]